MEHYLNDVTHQYSVSFIPSMMGDLCWKIDLFSGNLCPEDRFSRSNLGYEEI